MRIGLVVPRYAFAPRGGAEALYRGLLQALRRTPHEVELLEVLTDESSFDAALESYLAFHDLDVSPYDLVISTKAPTYMVRHPHHVAYLQHTMRVFYDLFEREFGAGTAELHRQRRIVHALDRHGLAPERVRAHFAVGSRSFLRLARADPWWQRIAFQVLHPPPALDRFPAPRRGEYILVPGRLHRWKRVDLVVRAFQRMRSDVALKIAGTGEDEAALRELAASDPRIEFLGYVSDDQLLELYSRALVVPFTPIEEDYGLVTIEAFRARKPVLTCTDSGEPTVFVRNFETGFVVEPTPDGIAERLAYLVDHPDEAAAMGERGCASVAHITWERVVDGLLPAAPPSARRARVSPGDVAPGRTIRVLVTDNQIIEPAVGGGRLRLLGLYATLCEGIEATYVGTYDWPGAEPGRREITLSERLCEIDVPLSSEHFALNARLNEILPGRTIIDVTIPWLVWSSPELVETVRRHAARADVVVCSHPWMYECVREAVREGEKLLVYDAHNCEARLRAALLGDTPFGRCLAQSAERIERELCAAAEIIFTCSEEDREDFADLYGVGEKVVVVTNGVDVERIRPASDAARSAARQALGVAGCVAVFTGSRYPPNVEAVEAIARRLAPATPAVTYLVVGGAGDAVARLPRNVRVLGAVSDEVRNRAYAAADIAVNPMSSGSGTNIKMFDFLAAGLATVTTEIGARGIAEVGCAFVIDELGAFPHWIERLRGDPALRATLAARGRALVEERYDWRDISRRVGELLLARTGHSAATPPPPRPRFSVVVASFERHEALRALLGALDRQTFRDFEVIVVDQSREPLDVATLRPSFPLRYVQRTERGATRARNAGVRCAVGEVIAFTDDDCLPDARWLEAAHERLQDGGAVGLEGSIASDRHDREGYRIVSNEDFSGFGFMTANLFVRREVFDQIGGFDERFEDPHFREDTDLAWRALAHGPIPFAPEARVVHPAHPRTLARESAAERGRFFVHDALLFAKHPGRYVKLLMAERHFEEPGFWDEFMKGMIRHRVEVAVEPLAPFTTEEQFALLAELARAIRAGEVDLSPPRLGRRTASGPSA